MGILGVGNFVRSKFRSKIPIMHEFSKNPLNAHKEQDVNFYLSYIIQKKIFLSTKEMRKLLFCPDSFLLRITIDLNLSVVPTFSDFF